MSKRNARIVVFVTGAIALASVGFALARRSRAAGAPAPLAAQREIEPNSSLAAPELALELDDAFAPGSAIDEMGEVTARPSEHAPAPASAYDDDAPSPDDLGLAWLKQATESEPAARSSELGVDVDAVSAADLAPDDTGDADDETVQEYVRRHRISSIG